MPDTMLSISAKTLSRIVRGPSDPPLDPSGARSQTVVRVARSLVAYTMYMEQVAAVLPADSGKKLLEQTKANIGVAVRGWCGNEPRPIRIPIPPIVYPPEPEPGPDWKFNQLETMILGVELQVGLDALANKEFRAGLESGAKLAFEIGAKQIG